MDVLLLHKKALENELVTLVAEEDAISAELDSFFRFIQDPSQSSTNATLSAGVNFSMLSNTLYSTNINLGSEVNKLGKVDLILESLENQSQKLSSQVQDCKHLSEHLSKIVRQLDHKQMAAQRALATTEDILSLKDCKNAIFTAIDQNDLVGAVKSLRQVAHMDQKAIQNSEDYIVVKEKEGEIKQMVLQAFQTAIETNDIDSVLVFCPMLTFLHIHNEVLHNLLAYFNNKIFSTLSTEHMAASNQSTEGGTAYIDSLAYIYNTFYVIIQTYLHVVLQGLDSCYGDILFIQNIHAKVEQEVQIVMKKYIKYRNLNDPLPPIHAHTTSNATPSPVQSIANLHNIVDEIALIVQYGSKYIKYLKVLCDGAESRIREGKNVDITTYTHNPIYKKMSFHTHTNGTVSIKVFPNLPFESMLDEFIHKYYVPYETYIIKHTLHTHTHTELDVDSVYVVYQKVGLRGVATHHMHACTNILHTITHNINHDLHTHLSTHIQARVHSHIGHIAEYMKQYKKSVGGEIGGSTSTSGGSSNITRQFFSMLGGAAAEAGGSSATITSTTAKVLGGVGVGSGGGLECLILLDQAINYTDRLNQHFTTAIANVFESAPRTSSAASSSAGGGEREKLVKVCSEGFLRCTQTFHQLLRQSLDKATSPLSSHLHDLLRLTTDPTLPSLYIHYTYTDSKFEEQPNLYILPRIYTTPMEYLLHASTQGLTEKVSDKVVGYIAEVCVEQFERYIRNTRMSFAASLKWDEVVRALLALFGKFSTSPIRSKFTRLKEVMQVLTSPSLKDIMGDHACTSLTVTDVEAVFSMRVD